MRLQPRVLFLGEAVTLAHVARTVSLAASLAPGHAVCVAMADHAHRFAPEGGFELRPLETLPGARFIEALRKGAPVYDEATLERYVQADLTLIDAWRPDLVVGDFRLSMSVSARLRGVPCLTITNAYWSPWYRQPAPLPVLPWTRYVPLPLASALFAIARRPAMAAHAAPLNRVRARHRLPALGRDLRRVYTDADHVAYADVPELLPTPGAPPTHAHIGPILWVPPAASPAWWDEAVPEPTAYVTMGSSGNPALLDSIVRALDAHGVSALVATAGATFTASPGSRARVAHYLPGTEAARRATLVVCNGGSLTGQQALAAGKPVLGIASNMDQFFNMRALEQAGAGITVRADRADARTLAAAIDRLLHDPAHRSAAGRLSGVFARYSAAARFRAMVSSILGRDSAGAPRHEKDPAVPDPRLRSSVQPGLSAGVGHEPPGP